MTEQNSAEISELQQKANAGDAQAQFELALFYAEGKGIEKNTELSLDWLKKSAELGYVEAQFALGLYYFLGVNKVQNNKVHNKFFKGGEDDDRALKLSYSLSFSKKRSDANGAQAFICFTKAAEQNHAEATYWLGKCYQNSWGTEKNDESAFIYFKQSAKQGCAEAYYELALCYQNGNNTEVSAGLFIEWLMKAAEQDVPDAQYLLACCYFEGKQFKQDNELAFSWLRKATKGGLNEARIRLAKCYEDGIGTEKSDGKAFDCYVIAEIMGCAEASYWIARYYFNGGILKLLDEQDSRILSENPNYWRIIYLEKGYERAFNSAKQAVEHGCLDAYLLLGFMSVYGIGTEQDDEHAAEYFIEASKHSQKGIADYFLANYYKRKNDNKLANYHFKRANVEKVLQFYDFEKLVENTDDKLSNTLYFLSVRLHADIGNYDLARSLIEKSKNQGKKETIFALSYVDNVEQLEQKNKELHEKEKEMLSFFTHTMRNALATAPESLRQAIHLLGGDVYEKDTKHYKAINKIAALFSTLSLTDCLIDTFKQSISDPQEFQQSWEMDQSGDATPEWVIASALRQSLNRIIFMSDTTELRKFLSTQETTLIKTTRKSFIEEVLPLNVDSQGIDAFYEWSSRHIPSINVLISDTNHLHFGVNQTRFSLLFAITSELILNALKYWDGENQIQISWQLDEQKNYVFSVTNHCKKNASSGLAGTHKGLAFITRLVELFGDQASFDCKSESQVFIAQLILHKTLFNGD